MKILLDEERVNLVTLEHKLKENIEIAKKFQTEAEYTQKEKQLQAAVERYQYHIKERKHRQFTRDLADFKDNKVYSTLPGRPIRRELESELSSTETDVSDPERNLIPLGQKSKNKGKRGRYRGKITHGQGRVF